MTALITGIAEVTTKMSFDEGELHDLQKRFYTALKLRRKQFKLEDVNRLPILTPCGDGF